MLLFVLTVLIPVVLRSWKSTLIVALDACFKLKLKDRSFKDPDLGTGLAYMANEEKYQRHLAHCSQVPLAREVSVISSFASVSTMTNGVGSSPLHVAQHYTRSTTPTLNPLVGILPPGLSFRHVVTRSFGPMVPRIFSVVNGT